MPAEPTPRRPRHIDKIIDIDHPQSAALRARIPPTRAFTPIRDWYAASESKARSYGPAVSVHLKGGARSLPGDGLSR